jgi:hypothetical protein
MLEYLLSAFGISRLPFRSHSRGNAWPKIHASVDAKASVAIDRATQRARFRQKRLSMPDNRVVKPIGRRAPAAVQDWCDMSDLLTWAYRMGCDHLPTTAPRGGEFGQEFVRFRKMEEGKTGRGEEGTSRGARCVRCNPWKWGTVPVMIGGPSPLFRKRRQKPKSSKT